MRTLSSIEQAIIISRNLKKLRKKAGFTQEQVAEMIGIHRISYTHYETGSVLMKIQHLVILANIFGVTTDELLKGSLEEMDKEYD